ncbi:MAG: D-alanyl-D-alanine carboxypeptidase, partial [Methyloceanibacter sp.]|nr:D-alanyl-D-alanine carboxypeptidase [Methyloceanibacter sp.]
MGVVFAAGATDAATKKEEGFTTKAQNAILLDSGADLVLYEKNADTRIPPASMSKLMTLAVVFREL